MSGGALSALSDPPSPADSKTVLQKEAGVQTLIDRLKTPEEPISREGTGLLIVQAPGERYRLQFRLIARGPEAMRMEIFDPFGRPAVYVFSYQGTIRLFSIPQKKEIPFHLPSLKPWSFFSAISFSEIVKIFWGRVPLFPYDSYQTIPDREKGKPKIKFELRGSVLQEIWLTADPFSVIRSRITSPSREGEIEIFFSDFSEAAGNRTPMKCEIKDSREEYTLTLRYDAVIFRPEIPDEIFEFPQLTEPPSSETKTP
jgi:hypothetical protein